MNLSWPPWDDSPRKVNTSPPKFTSMKQISIYIFQLFCCRLSWQICCSLTLARFFFCCEYKNCREIAVFEYLLFEFAYPPVTVIRHLIISFFSKPNKIFILIDFTSSPSIPYKVNDLAHWSQRQYWLQLFLNELTAPQLE